MLTQQRLKEVLNYNWLSGLFVWKQHYFKSYVGKVAGCFDRYVQIKIDGKVYLAHRLAWLYVYGKWPDGEIDHKDTVKHHNWFSNLRDTTHSGNQQNKIKEKANSKTGILGVSYCEIRDNFIAQIVVGGKKKNLGRFNTSEEAQQVYLKVKRVLHSTCTI